MADRIKGITVVIGGDVTGLNKALSDVNKEIRTTQSQLKDVERLLKMDPGNVELLEQRQRLLGDAVEETKKKLDSLKKSSEGLTVDDAKYEKWQKAFSSIQGQITKTTNELTKLEKQQKSMEAAGDVDSDAYRKVQADIDATQKKLEDLQKEAKDTFEEMGRPISTQQYDAVQREIIATNNDLKNLQKQANESNVALSKIRATASKISAGAGKVSSAMAPVTAGIVGLGTAAVATIPATQELRSDLSKLEANAKENAISADVAREAWRAFAIQSGETDSAVEAVSNLLQAGFTESNLQKAVEGLAGAAQRFPDTLKIESLADSLQETLATGEATGQFGELLDRLGVGAENFSNRLAACTTEAQKQDLALKTLAEAGLNETYEAWAKNNEEMLANQEANLKLQESLSELAETLLPLVTQITEAVAGLLDWFNGLDEGTQKLIITALLMVAAISPIAKAVSLVSGGIGTLSGGISALVGGLTSGTAATKGLASALTLGKTAVTALGSAINLGPVLAFGALAAIIFEVVYAIYYFADDIRAALDSVDSWLQNVFAKDWTEVFGETLGGALNGFFDTFEGLWNSFKSILEGIVDFIEGVFSGDWEQAWNGIIEILKGVFSGIAEILKAPVNAVIALLNGAIGAINKLIDGLNSFHFEVPDWVPGLGGKSFGFNLSHIKDIPYLAKGGILRSGSAIVGEAGPELLTVTNSRTIVQPLTGSSAAAQPGQVYNYVDNTQNIFKVDDIATYVAIEERMKYEKQSRRMGYVGR